MQKTPQQQQVNVQETNKGKIMQQRLGQENNTNSLSLAAILDRLFSGFRDHSEVFAAVGAEDVVFARQETTADKRLGAPLAVEAVGVPLALLKGDVLASPET